MKIGKENEVLEFKRSTAEIKESIESIAAILNKHGGGELYFGVRNDGTPVGMDISDKTLRDVSQGIANHLTPKIYPSINEVYLDNRACIHVEFSGEDKPYYAFGRAYIRIADEDRVMSPEELESYIVKRNIVRNTWDNEVSDSVIGDVDEEVLREYLERANRADRIDFSYSTRDDVLRRLEATDGDKLKNAADVLFVGSHLLEVQMAIFAGTEKLTFLDIKRENGSITSLIKAAEKFIHSNMRWRVEFDGSIQRKEIPEIPTDAIREAIVNSFCHRLFTLSQNNEVAIYSDRIEIYNPGTFPDGLEPESFISGKEKSIKRNPVLAQLMYYSKDIESFGTGLKRIKDTCKDAGIRVEFQQLKRGFSVIFYRPGEQFLTTENDTDVVRSVVINVALSQSEQDALSLIIDKPDITAEQIALTISKSTRTIQRYLSKMQDKNIIKRVGSTKSGYWEVSNSD